MNDKEFGQKIRRLREERSITREEFCQDEVELSVRQLARIEAGTCKPTLPKISYIATRFGMTLYELMPDYIALPERYQRLKYDVLRTPTYEQPDLVSQRDASFSEIYEVFYDDLPEEEQLAIDALRSSIDVLETQSADFGKEILDDYFHQVYVKDKYTINDLLIIRLFADHIRLQTTQDSVEYEHFLELVERLPQQIVYIRQDDLFVLRDALFKFISVLGSKGEYRFIPDLFLSLDEIISLTQDFQKKPIISMLRWKFELFARNDQQAAQRYFEEAVSFAQLINNEYLVEKMKEDWQQDCKR